MYAIIQHNSNFPDRDTTIKLNASVFEEYVNPTSLSSIASRITRDQEKRAAAMLAVYFGF